MSQFLQDVLQGLSAPEKYLNSKYFYDAAGDVIFQQIMACKEYYPTKCELEIFTTQNEHLVAALAQHHHEFDIVELGAGDATKSVHLLDGLLKKNISFTYYPVDISSNVIRLLENKLPRQLPSLRLQGLNGEYFEMLQKAKTLSKKIKVVLFLGSNIGNVPLDKAVQFCSSLRQHLSIGDIALIGFDLKKDPKVVLDAYNDSAGLTRDFNLNLLHRINKELQGTFDLACFYHYPVYDPYTGACKSFLVSKEKHSVAISGHAIHFRQGEPIFMEISQKFTVDQTDGFATEAGFRPLHHFFDSRKWFLDAVWECV